MAIRDAIVLNTTGSSFEALQSGDTVRVKGDLLVQDSSGTSLLSVGTSDTTVTLGGSVTSSAIISGSSTSTASFGRFVATTYTGDAREIASTLPRSAGIISGAAQIRDDVSGSFVSGFSFGATADQLYVGVSGSNSEHSASVSGSTRAMAASGSDLTHLKSDEIGHIRGIVGAGTFTAGDALGTGRGYVLGAGSQNAALAFGGYGPSNTRNKTEHYNGTSWSEGGNLNQNHHNGQMGAGWGVEYAAIKTGGNGPGLTTSTEVYNGTSWSEIQNKTVGQCCGGGAGTQNAGVAFGGNPSPNTTEHWNGTSWSTGGTMIAGGDRINCGAGLENAALAAGVGGSPTPNTCTEEYDGTSWSAGGILSDKKSRAGTAGTQNAAIAIDGLNGSSDDVSLHYDGASWSVGGSSLHNKFDVAAVGVQSAALKFGGTYFQTCTEQYNANYTNTGSFGRIEAGYIVGNAEDIKGQIPRDAGLVTSSAQLATDISGSFTSGFNFGAPADSHFIGVSGSTPTPGVSGSETHYSSSVGHPAEIYASGSASGSDHSFQLVDELGHIKGVVEAGAWSLGPNINNPRQDNAGAGVQNAALSFGGYPPTGHTEIYNGTTWSELNDLNLARANGGGLGTVDAALYMGGQPTISCTEEWNGTSWSEVTNMTTARANNQGVGTQNAGLIFGGNPGIATTEEYNGTSFSAGGSLITAIFGAGGAGIQNAALKFGGSTPSVSNTTEHYNGTSWTAGGNLITARTYLKGAGVENSALAVMGLPAAGTLTEHYDGTSWSAGGSLNIARSSGAATGVSHAAIAMGGAPATSHRESTELYEGSFSNSGSFGRIEATILKGNIIGLQNYLVRSDNIVSGSAQIRVDVSGSFDEGFSFGASNARLFDGVSGSRFTPGVSGSEQFYSSSFGHVTEHIGISGSHPSGGADYSQLLESEAGHIRGKIVSGVWSSGGALITARKVGSLGTGVENAALAGDIRGAPNNDAEEYNGTAWSVTADMINARGFGAAAGTQNASFFAGGTTPGTYAVPTEDYNGVSFSNIANSNLNTGRQKIGGAGSQNAGLVFGGTPSAPKQQTEEWNGVVWTEAGATAYLSDAGYNIVGAGIQNAALAIGGQPSSARKVSTEHYDGTSWRAGGTLITTNGHKRSGAGTENASWVAFGQAPANSTHTEVYDGIAWTSTANAITARSLAGAAGTGAVGLAFGGYNPGQLSCTEHWDGGFENTGSFGRIESARFVGDASDLSSSLGLVESSATIASDISGSFSSGFNIAVRKGGSAKDLINDEGAILTDPTRWCWTSSSFNDPQNYSLRSTLKPRGHFQVDRRHINAGSGSLATWSQGTPLISRKRTLIGGSTGPRDAIMLVGAGQGEYGGCGRTELYDGVAWYEGKFQSNGRRGKIAFGTQNAGVAHGGRSIHTYKNDTENWDGISWTTVISHNSAVSCSIDGIGFGTQNDGLIVSFASGSPSSCQDICHYDGTTFSRGAEMVYSQAAAGGAGDSDCAIIFGGNPSGNRKQTQEYNGTSWVQRANLTFPATLKSGAGENYRRSCQALGFGGLTPGRTVNAEVFDSTINSWSTTAALSKGRGYAGVQAGNNQSAYAVGGFHPAPDFDGANAGTLEVEYYDEHLIGTGSFGSVIAGQFWGDGTGVSASLFSKILSGSLSSSAQIADDISGSWSSGIVAKGDIIPGITDGVWSTANCIPGRSTPNAAAGGCFRSNTMYGSGYAPSQPKDTWLYNDISWRAAGELFNQTNPTYNAEIVGGETNFMFLGGDQSLDRNQIYDGKAWYQNSNLPNPHSVTLGVAGAGDPKVETHITGKSPACNGLHLIWNTLAWSVGPGLSMEQTSHNSVGGGSAVLNYGGMNPSAGCEIVQRWDGTTWAHGQPMNVGQRFGAGFGSGVNDALINTNCHNLSPAHSGTQVWNGTSWKIGNASTFNRKIPTNFGGGNGTHGLATGNQPSPTSFEEWNVYYCNDATGSFGAVQPKSTFRVTNFTATGSVFRLPIFNEHDTSAHYFVSRSKQPGEMWFNKSRNSIFYTWESSSISTSMCGSSGEGDPNNQYTQSFKVSTVITSQISSSRYTGSWGEIEQEYI